MSEEEKKNSLSLLLVRVPDGGVGDRRVLFHDLAREREALGELEVCWGGGLGGRRRRAVKEREKKDWGRTPTRRPRKRGAPRARFLSLSLFPRVFGEKTPKEQGDGGGRRLTFGRSHLEEAAGWGSEKKKEEERDKRCESCDSRSTTKKRKKKRQTFRSRQSSSLSLRFLSQLLLKKTQMGKLKSVLPVAQAVHRLCRLGGMPEPRWLAAAERCDLGERLIESRNRRWLIDSLFSVARAFSLLFSF